VTAVDGLAAAAEIEADVVAAAADDVGRPMPAQAKPTDIRISTLDNGIAVLLEEMPWVHSASLGVWIKVGSSRESVATNGVSHLLEHLFFKGTPTRDARQIVEAVEKSGGSANAFTGRENTCLYVKMLDSHLHEGLDLLADILCNSLFCDFDKELQIVLEEIASVNDSPEELVHDLFMEDMWPDHPLGLPIAGKREGVSKLTIDQVREYYLRQYVADNIVIAAAGNFDSDDLLNRIGGRFAGMNTGTVEKGPAAPKQAAGVWEHTRDIEQTQISFGAAGVSACDDRRYTMAILSTILGGNAMSRLFQRVREAEGLAYSVYSFTSAMELTGTVGVSAAVTPQNVNRTMEIVLEEIDRMRTELVPSDEMHNAREYLKGSIILGLEGTFNRMSRMARGHMYRAEIEDTDIILERIDKVTPKDVQNLATQVFGREKETLTTLGPPKTK
jgi:predicted Zn-dependent peptidase